jgi:subfamily B ATP-binding cassette protein HlyB/CyaB
MTIGKKKRPPAAADDCALEQGVTALTVRLRFQGKAVAPDDVRRHCRKGVFDVAEMPNCGRALG